MSSQCFRCSFETHQEPDARTEVYGKPHEGSRLPWLFVWRTDQLPDSLVSRSNVLTVQQFHLTCRRGLTTVQMSDNLDAVIKFIVTDSLLFDQN